jgi:hypothetical protein
MPVQQLVAFGPVLAEQRRQVLDRRRLQRHEAERLVDALHDRQHVAAADDVGSEEVAHAARGLGGNGLAHRCRMV